MLLCKALIYRLIINLFLGRAEVKRFRILSLTGCTQSVFLKIVFTMLCQCCSSMKDHIWVFRSSLLTLQHFGSSTLLFQCLRCVFIQFLWSNFELVDRLAVTCSACCWHSWGHFNISNVHAHENNASNTSNQLKSNGSTFLTGTTHASPSTVQLLYVGCKEKTFKQWWAFVTNFQEKWVRNESSCLRRQSNFVRKCLLCSLNWYTTGYKIPTVLQ